MRKILPIFLGLVLSLPSLSFSGIYMGLEPGLSKKSDVDRVMGKPIKEIVKGERYEYDPRGMDARQVAVRFNKQNQIVEGIDIVPQRLITKSKYQKWLGLRAPDVTKKYSNGNLVEYYLEQGISLLYSSSQDTSPVACFSHFNPMLLQPKTAGEKPDSPQTKAEVAKKTQASEEDRRYGEDVPALLEDDFESENGRKGALNYTNFRNWDVIQGSVDLIGMGLWDYFPDHGLHIDLDGTTRKGGSLSSKRIFKLEPGTYRLEFDLAGNPLSGPDTVTVVLGKAYNESFTLGRKEPFRRITRTISVSTNQEARLSFKHAGGDNEGLFLDNIRLARLSAGKPTKYPEQKTAEGPNILGQWRWFNGYTVIINAGGSMVSLSDGKIVNSGKWKALAGGRHYQLEWKEGGWVDKLAVSADGKTLKGNNQHGGGVSATRISQ